ncbi:DUF3800 domain-containing protein [Candidatus Gottesmanbacteria bacterium]|nr:DUF3800 domain-containing protein [Candidatus Gottesmanbacteria bacterium]
MAYIFLDESGDLGFTSGKKNSDYFVITFIACEDKRALEKVVKNVHRSLRKKIKRLSGGVLHCYKEKPKTRRKMLSIVSGLEISVMTVCLNKSRVHTNLKEEKHLLYNYVANILLDRILTKKLVSTSGKVTLIASKRETNRFLNENFSSYLADQARRNHKMNLEILIRTPSEEKGLQAADFVSWSIFKKYEESDDTYYKMIKKKIVEENMLFGSNTTKP